MNQLTPRELQCVKLCAECLTAKEIAARLNVADQVVENWLSRSHKKLGITNQKQLVHYALHHKLTENIYALKPRGKKRKT